MATTYAIPDGRVAMAATLWSGNSTSQNIANTVNGVAMQPDLVWVKSRTNTQWNNLTDSVRGVTKLLYSNATNAEATNSTALTSFNTNGFSVGDDSGGNGVNTSGQNYVGWQWKAGGTAVSNTAGSITSSVSANTTAGFSVVTYTGTGANATVGHGLGVAPSMVICKSRTTANSWVVYHTSIGNTQYLVLNSTGAAGTLSTFWNNTSPTSTVFSLGSASNVNQSGDAQLAYCFAPVAGYSAFGSYTGNGSADGPFVFTNFRPRYVMIKRTDTAGYHWGIWDTSVNTYNLEQLSLYADSSSAEINATDLAFDGLSNGFKLRGTSLGVNASGGTYIYYAVAENPFKYANAR